MVEQAAAPRKTSPEIRVIIGTGVTLLVSMIASTIAIASLFLTVAGWQRTDMRDLRQKVEAIEVGQSDIRERLKAIEVGQVSILDRLRAVEVGQVSILDRLRAVEVGLVSILDRLRAVEIGQDSIRDRLTAVESRIGSVVVEPEREVGRAIGSP